MKRLVIGLLAIFVMSFFVQAHYVTLIPYNQTSEDGSFFFESVMGIDPFNNQSNYTLKLALLPLENQDYRGNLTCEFYVNASQTIECVGMSLTSVGFDEANETGNETNITVAPKVHSGLIGSEDDKLVDNGSQEGNETGGNVNQTALFGRFLVVVNKTYYDGGAYNLTIELVDGNVSLNYSEIAFAFPKPEIVPISAPVQKIVSGGGRCTTTWSCTEWSQCTNGFETRECEKIRPNCIATPYDSPDQIQTCSVQEEVEEEAPIQQPLLSRITGAVVGAPGSVKFTGVIVFLALLTGAFIYVRARANMPPHEK